MTDYSLGLFAVFVPDDEDIAILPGRLDVMVDRRRKKKKKKILSRSILSTDTLSYI